MSEEIHLYNPEEYLNRYTNTHKEVSEDVLEDSLNRLNKPLKEIKYAESGIGEVDAGNIKFNFSYSQVPEILKSGIINYIHGPHAGGNPDSEYGDPNNWRKLDDLNFNIEGKRVNLLAALPNNLSVVFCPTTEYFNGALYRTRGCIYIIGDITSPRSIVTLLHEMGHVFDDENFKKERVTSLIGRGLHYGTAEKLRQERTVTAFAFKVLRPILEESELKEDIINFLKNYALAAYNRSAQHKYEIDEYNTPYREKEARRTQGDAKVQQQEEAEQQLWDDYEEWQKTDAYKKWKETPESKDVENVGEYGTWRYWVEKTGYEYWKDFPDWKGELEGN